MREETEPLFETEIQSLPADNGSITDNDQTKNDHIDQEKHDQVDHQYNTPELHRSSRTTQFTLVPLSR